MDWAITPTMTEFVKSASKLEECPRLDLPEIAFVGRSNAGKSSLLNALYGKGLAKVSSRPGHTRLLNFFQVDRDYAVVDLPGYGFAARGGKEAKGWQSMIEGYILGREELRALILVIDVRRNWQDEEQGLLQWMHTNRQLPVFLALSKRDKLNQKELSRRKKYFADIDGLTGQYYISSTKGTAVKEMKLDFEKKLLT